MQTPEESLRRVYGQGLERLRCYSVKRKAGAADCQEKIDYAGLNYFVFLFALLTSRA
jgi:hypothetical protein